MIRLLGQRQCVVANIADIKKKQEMDPNQPQRNEEILATRREWGIKHHIDPKQIEQIWKLILQQSIAFQVAKK